QQEAQPLGYSPIPPNLVQIGFDVEHQIPGAVPTPSIYACNDPTITGCWLNVNHIPAAPACLTNGHGVPVIRGRATGPKAAGPATTAGGGAGASGNTAGAGSAGTAGSATTATAGAGTATTTGKGQQVASGPLASGQQANGLRSSGSGGAPAVLSGKNVSFGKPWSSAGTDALIAAAALLIVLAPPAVALVRRRHR
ncbi:MAG: hypothetical protein J2P57_00915, partial [Acidimicrobiaceae bacterium]|nr:hypothetical protein [Acidimicrobiaceae bacterium]